MIEMRWRISAALARVSGMPATATRSGCWRDQRAQDPHGRRLARPVRSQEPEHFATGDAERHIIDCGPAAEILGQVPDFYRRRPGAGLPPGLVTGRRRGRDRPTRLG